MKKFVALFDSQSPVIKRELEKLINLWNRVHKWKNEKVADFYGLRREFDKVAQVKVEEITNPKIKLSLTDNKEKLLKKFNEFR